MRGYMVMPGDSDEATGEQDAWEAMVVDSVGNLIEFWGFKRNQGRVWTLLYLKGAPLAASQIQGALGLSKGAVSMITRELEQWGVIHRVRPPGSAAWHFVAETNLMQMVQRVVSERELNVVSRVKADLGEAERQARLAGDADEDAIDRLMRMRMLATMFEASITSFLKTACLDARDVMGVLGGGASRDGSR